MTFVVKSALPMVLCALYCVRFVVKSALPIALCAWYCVRFVVKSVLCIVRVCSVRCVLVILLTRLHCALCLHCS